MATHWRENCSLKLPDTQFMKKIRNSVKALVMPCLRCMSIILSQFLKFLVLELKLKGLRISPVAGLYKTFNMGIGMMIVVAPNGKGEIEKILKDYKIFEIGRIIKGDGKVIFK